MLERDFRINSLNVHRLLLARLRNLAFSLCSSLLNSVMVAAKFLDDFYYSNEFWAKVRMYCSHSLLSVLIPFVPSDRRSSKCGIEHS